MDVMLSQASKTAREELAQRSPQKENLGPALVSLCQAMLAFDSLKLCKSEKLQKKFSDSIHAQGFVHSLVANSVRPEKSWHV